MFNDIIKEAEQYSTGQKKHGKGAKGQRRSDLIVTKTAKNTKEMLTGLQAACAGPDKKKLQSNVDNSPSIQELKSIFATISDE